MSPTDERLNTLELKYTELEHTVEELNGVVYQQGQQIAALTAELLRLQEKLKSEPGLVDGAINEKPPHY